MRQILGITSKRPSLCCTVAVLMVLVHLENVGEIQEDNLLSTSLNSLYELVSLFQQGSIVEFDDLNHLNDDEKEEDLQLSEVATNSSRQDGVRPLVQVVLLARDKAFMLPTFLAHLEAQNYPKDRMILYVRADHCKDHSIDILQDWLSDVQDLYNTTDVILDRTSRGYLEEEDPNVYTTASYEGIINLKEDALQNARQRRADFVVFIDIDVIITNTNLIDHFVSHNFVISGPVLHSLFGDQYGNFWPTYSNKVWFDEYYEKFWGDRWHSRSYFYYMNVRTCLHAFLIHSCLFIDLRQPNTAELTFDSDKLPELNDVPRDDLVTFAHSAEWAGIESYVCNTEYYGVVMPPTNGQTKIELEQEFEDIRMLALKKGELHPAPKSISKYSKELASNKKDKLGFDQIFYINLERRPERRLKMEQRLDLVGVDATRVDAVDGRKLTDELILEKGIRQLDDYRNPYEGTNMTKGEFGCFLSHYYLWKEIVDKNYSQVMILEDDASFLEGFRLKMHHLQHELNKLPFSYDLVYIGRDAVYFDSEEKVSGSSSLLYADYSNWTLGYILSRSGALKLLNEANLLSKLLPLDLYMCSKANSLPVEWTFSYSPRDMVALAMVELAVEPSSIEAADEDFVSDTSYVSGLRH